MSRKHQDDLKQSMKVQNESWQYEIIEDSYGTPKLYRKIHKYGLLIWYLSKRQGIAILNDIHSGAYGNHFAGRRMLIAYT